MAIESMNGNNERIGTRVPVKEIGTDGYFIYHKELWVSLGNLRPGSHMITAGKVAVKGNGREGVILHTDFQEDMSVKPYYGTSGNWFDIDAPFKVKSRLNKYK